MIVAIGISTLEVMYDVQFAEHTLPGKAAAACLVPNTPRWRWPQCKCLMSAGLILVHALACSNGSVEDDILHTYGRLVEKVGGGWSAVEFWNIHAPSHGVLPWHHGFGSSGVRFLLAIAPPIYCLWPTNYGQ